MTHRGYLNDPSDRSLAAFAPRRRPTSYDEHKGVCACGVETTRYVTTGPPGHPENGWQCHGCGEAHLRAIFDRAQRSV